MLTVYLTCLIGGLSVLVLLVILGLEHEFGHEVGIEHEVSIEHEVGHEIGHEVHVEHGVGHVEHEAVGAVEHEIAMENPSKLSLRIMMAGLTGIGLGGFMGMKLLANVWDGFHFITAFAGLVLFWVLGYQMAKFFYRQQGTTMVLMSKLVGKVGVITSRVPGLGIGEVKVRDEETGLENTFFAKSSDGKPINQDEEVVIERVNEGNKFIVAKRARV